MTPKPAARSCRDSAGRIRKDLDRIKNAWGTNWEPMMPPGRIRNDPKETWAMRLAKLAESTRGDSGRAVRILDEIRRQRLSKSKQAVKDVYWTVGDLGKALYACRAAEVRNHSINLPCAEAHRHKAQHPLRTEPSQTTARLGTEEAAPTNTQQTPPSIQSALAGSQHHKRCSSRSQTTKRSHEAQTHMRRAVANRDAGSMVGRTADCRHSEFASNLLRCVCMVLTDSVLLAGTPTSFWTEARRTRAKFLAERSNYPVRHLEALIDAAFKGTSSGQESQQSQALELFRHGFLILSMTEVAGKHG